MRLTKDTVVRYWTTFRDGFHGVDPAPKGEGNWVRYSDFVDALESEKAALLAEVDNATEFALEIVAALGYRTDVLEYEIECGAEFPSKQIILETIGQLELGKAELAALTDDNTRLREAVLRLAGKWRGHCIDGPSQGYYDELADELEELIVPPAQPASTPKKASRTMFRESGPEAPEPGAIVVTERDLNTAKEWLENCSDHRGEQILSLAELIAAYRVEVLEPVREVVRDMPHSQIFVGGSANRNMCINCLRCKFEAVIGLEGDK